MVAVTVARSIGHRFRRISSQVASIIYARSTYAAALTSEPKYFSEIRFSVPSARSSSSARLTSAISPLSLRAANACSLVSPVVPAILMPVSLFVRWYSTDREGVVDGGVDARRP